MSTRTTLPTEASGVGVFAALLLGALRGRLNWPTLSKSMDSSVKSLGMLFFFFVGATAFAYIFRKVGGEHSIVDTARSLPFGDWEQLFAVNLDAAFHITQAALPLLEQGGGSIVYIASLAAKQNGPYPNVGYEVSKEALCRLSQSVAIECAARGVRCNTVVPGMIDTTHVSNMIAPDQPAETVRANRAAQVPMKRQGTGWDIAEASLFLASDAAAFITGVDLRVDGGMGILMGNAAS